MKLILMGNPIYQKRHRTTKWGTYDPSHKDKLITRISMENWMFSLSYMQKMELQNADYFLIHLNFYLPIAKSTPIRKRNKLLWRNWYPEKPDYDNMAKYYSDCATGVIWSDDKLVCQAREDKFCSVNPRVEMTITPKQFLDDDAAMEILANFTPDEWDELKARFDQVSLTYGHPDYQKNIARFMSYMGALWSKRLAKIAKQHPEYYKTTPEVSCE